MQNFLLWSDAVDASCEVWPTHHLTSALTLHCSVFLYHLCYVCLGLLQRAQSTVYMVFTSVRPGLAAHAQSVLLHVGNNTGSLPVFMTSSTVKATGSSLDVGHGNSFCSHGWCGKIKVGAILCSQITSFPSFTLSLICSGARLWGKTWKTYLQGQIWDVRNHFHLVLSHNKQHK